MAITPRFYMGYTRCRPNHIPLIASGEKDIRITHSGWLELKGADNPRIGLLENAIPRWSDSKQRFLHMWDYDTNRIIDSGGYNVQSQLLKDGVSGWEPSGESPIYPFTVEQYHNWLSDNADGIDWAACMDYACEEQFDPIWSVDDRVDATVENTIRQFDLHDGEYDLLPVLQGRSLEEYLDCYDRFEDAGVLDATDYRVGLGTVCRISSSEAIVDLELELRKRRKFNHIHGFGVKIEAYKMGASFESADSQAWVWHASHGEEYRDDVTRLKSLYVKPETYPDLGTSHCSLRRTVTSFREYYRYVSRLRDGEPALPPLEDNHTPPSMAHVKATDPEELVAD